MQNRFEALLADTVLCDLFDDVQHHRFQCVSVLHFAAFYAAAEHQLTHRVFKAAQRRGRAAQLGCFQSVLQGRGTVVQ